MENLDRYDKIILRMLQANGRASNVELSEQVNLSPPQCYRRVHRLEKEGIIRGYAAQVEPAAIGLGVTAFVSLNIAREQFKQVRKLEKIIRAFPEILECYAISGDFDYLLKVVANDLKSLSGFLTDRLMQVPGVAGVKSMVCLEEIKSPSPLPLAD
ncbi:Lrp/AsnC family transcriptional regulator [Glaciimonas immobilis]|uniref:Lrp/AsnC family leucine-responsive transcriptional regulator n=1 Tax=Glaciimonas immobilis TaxID=728004 RepID=A0A840RQG2_9BURK|nr:Lrp/AsnC family transcriptional regulator [Glaciimonas immobilis]KAF3997130.1 Lrp/AsnC family transcriptional regulator [Glaciimonas immobilis]MBB5199995.1 Lrp/AsnC family leucine-responsive transcriptional regulator [Glaciimonas immobilis]